MNRKGRRGSSKRAVKSARSRRRTRNKNKDLGKMKDNRMDLKTKEKMKKRRK